MVIIEKPPSGVKLGAKFYITTAIPYINAPPHIGHALEFVQADTIARYHKMRGHDVFLTTGADENSLKTVQAAAKQNVDPQTLCDKNSIIFEEVARRIGLSYNAFIRSSNKEGHWRGAEKLWTLCFEAGDIYKKTYEGLYCVGCEAFYTEKELVDGLCPEHLTPPEIVNEENYFFRLSKYEEKLKTLILNSSLKITPETKRKEILGFIKQGLDDFSVSRSAERSKNWGIPVPGDESQTIYVWFDALSVYLTGVGFGKDQAQFNRWWPADMHVIGKGVIRFHAVYWPAMLLSAGLDLPKEIMVHGYVTSEGQKISKSLGNVVDPLQMVNKFGEDVVRYYLLRSIPTFEDGDFSERELVTVSNGELVGNLGNFVHRTLTFIWKNYNGKVEAKYLNEEDVSLLQEVDSLAGEVDKDLSEARLGSALTKVLAISAIGNRYFQEKKPWKRVNSDRDECERTLFVCTNICITLGVSLRPYMPDTSQRILRYLNTTAESFADAKALRHGTISIIEPQPLFQKLSQEKT